MERKGGEGRGGEGRVRLGAEGGKRRRTREGGG